MNSFTRHLFLMVAMLFGLYYFIVMVFLSSDVHLSHSASSLPSLHHKSPTENMSQTYHLPSIGIPVSSNKSKFQCEKEVSNFVFIKCMKCATETLASIFRRFGYVRDLNFVLPVKRNLYLGWPYPLESSDIRPSNYEYNILVEHSVLNYTFMKALMPLNTKFITILRHPWSQLKSAFSYFCIGDIAKVPNGSFEKFLNNIEFYDKEYSKSENNWHRWCIPDGFSMTRNILAHCMGIPLGFPPGTKSIYGADNSVVRKYIEELDKTFALVMIADYFVESLVMLKRTMCWKFKDMFYYYSNAGLYGDTGFKNLHAEGNLYIIHRNWSSIDYQLFEYFNKTFWAKVDAEGPAFLEEVEHFKLLQAKVEKFCFVKNMWKEPSSILTIPGSKFEKTFNITGEDCMLMNMYLLPLLWARYFEKEGTQPEDFPSARPLKGCSM